MAYQLVSGLGDAASDALKKCGASLKDADLDSKAGREKSVTTASECTADAICAYYSKGNIPPGVCGPIGGAIAKETIKIWNSVFGDDSAQREALRKRREAAAYFAQVANALETDRLMAVARLNAAAALIALHDQLIPSRKGELGNMSGYRWSGSAWEREAASKPLVGSGELPMLKLLAQEGMLHRMSPQGWVNIPDAFYLGVMQGQVSSLATQERNKLLAVCAQYPTASFQYQMCTSKVPSQRAMETKILGVFAADNAVKFLDSLDKAALRARAVIAAKATAEQARIHAMQMTARTTKTSSTAATAGAIILLGGAAAAAVLIYRSRSKT